MALIENIRTELNKQLNAELYSAYLYLSMASFLDSIDFKGFANWMKVQAQEEMTHAMKFYDYLISNGSKPVMMKIDAPRTTWDDALDVFLHVYNHEVKVTALINNLVSVTKDAKDDATFDFLQWFVKEQVEEEESADEIVQKIRNDPDGLLDLDKELAKRR